jgi:hypothetical protein
MNEAMECGRMEYGDYAGLEKGNLLLFWWIWRLGMSKKGFANG